MVGCVQRCVRGILVILRRRRKKWAYRISSSTFIDDTRRLPYSSLSEDQLFTQQILSCHNTKSMQPSQSSEGKKLSTRDKQVFYLLMSRHNEIKAFFKPSNYRNIGGVFVFHGVYQQSSVQTCS